MSWAINGRVYQMDGTTTEESGERSRQRNFARRIDVLWEQAHSE
jgi:hypothetical protein